jgi:hypothetical protein
VAATNRIVAPCSPILALDVDTTKARVRGWLGGAVVVALMCHEHETSTKQGRRAARGAEVIADDRGIIGMIFIDD